MGEAHVSMAGNPATVGLAELMHATRQACEDSLASADLLQAAQALERAGITDADATPLVRSVTHVASTLEPLKAVFAKLASAGQAGADAAIERRLLLRTAVDALSSLDAERVSPSVKALLCEEIQSWTRLEDAEKRTFAIGTSRFVDMCMLASLRRFPAGQFDWVRGGVPLSYLLSVKLASMPRALYFTAVRMGGRAPVFFSHFGYRRLGHSLSEVEANRSYYRMARSMELQPDIKGLAASSWFRSPDTHRVSPHLAWVNKVVLENDGFVAVRGPADPDCGVFVRSQTRRRLYEAGTFTPTLGLVIWPRRAMLTWAAAHPELE
jgi:hypothetical protein